MLNIACLNVLAEEKVCQHASGIGHRNNEIDLNCVKVHRKTEFPLISLITGGLTHLPVVRCSLNYSDICKRHGRENHWWATQDTSFGLMSVPGISPRFLCGCSGLFHLRLESFTFWFSLTVKSVPIFFFPSTWTTFPGYFLSCVAQRFSVSLLNISQM